jgi:hypothetical protein
VTPTTSADVVRSALLETRPIILHGSSLGGMLLARARAMKTLALVTLMLGSVALVAKF